MFQGFVNDYGESPGREIVRHIVDHVGGTKVRIPQNNHKVNQHATICNDPLYGCGAQFRRLWWSCCEKFGQASGRAIMQKIICEFGGQRISFPDHMDIFRWERNEAILIQRQNGVAPKELGLRWGLCHHRILEILKD